MARTAQKQHTTITGSQRAIERIAEAWVRRRLGSVEHERRVCAVATTLFDLTLPLHQLGPEHLKVLRLGCLLHDVGRALDRKDHPAEGARLLARCTRLPVSSAQRRVLCFLARYHRGAVPKLGFDDYLTPADDPQAARTVLALLRAADALDGRNALVPRLVITMKAHKIAVNCYLEKECPKSRRVYGRRKKFRLLEELLDVRVQVRVKQAHTVHAVG